MAELMENFDETSDCESVDLDDDLPVLEGCGLDSEVDEDEETEDPEEDQGKNSYVPPSLLSTPDFIPLSSPFPKHEAEHRIPDLETFDKASPLAFFKLFVSDSLFETFATNTNAYARSKDAPLGRQSQTNDGNRKEHHRLLPWKPKPKRIKSPRLWYDTTEKELMVWFGLIIFMELVKSGAKTSRVNTYWKTDTLHSFEPMRHMGLVRFQQLKRFFHLSPPLASMPFMDTRDCSEWKDWDWTD